MAAQPDMPQAASALDTDRRDLAVPVDALGDAAASKAIASVLSARTSGSAAKLRKCLPLLKRAARLIRESEYRDAAVLGLKALDIDPDIALANHITAIALDKLGCLSLALEMYDRAQRLDPNEPEIYQNLGLLAWRMEMLDVAEKLFRIFCRLMPDAIEGPNNLACVLRDQGRPADAIEVLRTALYANDGSALLWNSLGTVMMEQSDFAQAILFYREALAKAPDLSRAWHNIGYCLATEGKHDAALDAYRTALDGGNLPPNERAETAHAEAVSAIAIGDLARGWELYESRLNPKYSKTTLFRMPIEQWDTAAPLAGRSILCVGEQGLGDEVLFLNHAHDLIKAVGPDGHVGFAVNTRLKTLVARSFPGCSVTAHGTVSHNGLPLRGCPSLEDWSRFDCWTPMASPLGQLRPDVAAFEGKGSYLTPDPERVLHWQAELENFGPGLKAGLLWKSMLMSARRSKYYSPFAQWADILREPGAVYVNLQYGECEEDMARAKRDFGVTIHTLDGIDLKNDLDDLAALTCALDLVAGPMNATTNIAAASGASVAIIGAPGSWPFLGTGKLPWYPQADVFSPQTISDWKPAMRSLNAHIRARIAENAARSVAA